MMGGEDKKKRGRKTGPRVFIVFGVAASVTRFGAKDSHSFYGTILTQFGPSASFEASTCLRLVTAYVST